MTMPKMKCSKPKMTNGFPNMRWGFKYYKIRFVWPTILILILFFTKIKKIYKFIAIFWMAITFLYFFIKHYEIKHYEIKKFFRLYYDTSDSNVGTKWCHFASLSAPALYIIQKFIKP